MESAPRSASAAPSFTPERRPADAASCWPIARLLVARMATSTIEVPLDRPPRSNFRSKAVRDLAWIMSSPNLLDQPESLSDQWSGTLSRAALPWLTQLDADDSELCRWLAEQRNCARLGFYFAALLEYWARFCPLLRPPADEGAASVLSQQQVHSGLGGAVAGQIKCVFKRRVLACQAKGAAAGTAAGTAGTSHAPLPLAPSTAGTYEGGDTADASGSGRERELVPLELVHWESHIKYFAFVPAAEAGGGSGVGGAAGGAAASAVAACGAEEEAASAEQQGLARYVGPFLGENLLHRVAELHRKLRITEVRSE